MVRLWESFHVCVCVCVWDKKKFVWKLFYIKLHVFFAVAFFFFFFSTCIAYLIPINPHYYCVFFFFFYKTNGAKVFSTTPYQFFSVYLHTFKSIISFYIHNIPTYLDCKKVRLITSDFYLLFPALLRFFWYTKLYF